ncbi:hypothetical protein ACHQM5_003923 [Ranunculus cassubicifolius]
MSISLSSSLSVLLIFFSIGAGAVVPASKTFKFVNEGSLFQDFYDPNEYNANYRYTDISGRVFMLCFYNTTPNAYTLGMRMGYQPSDNPIYFKWIWDANRGNPVREKAALTFHADGNLVLSDADGKMAWQTATSNKGVVDLKLLSNGNLVLLDKKGKFVWQSFDHPTDTLLVGQALRPGGPTRLVSRVSDKDVSDKDGSEDLYSFVMESTRLALYLESKEPDSPMLYYTNGENPTGTNPVVSMVFNVAAETTENYAYELRYEFHEESETSPRPKYEWTTILARPNYNSTYSFLRLESDGDLKIHTFYDKVDYSAWEVTYSLFGKEGFGSKNQCKLPKKCGSLGVCDKNQCVACPSPKGLKGWSESCAPPRLSECMGPTNVDYYKVVGVEHFTSEYNDGGGPASAIKCQEKCSMSCSCLGAFYREESSMCLLVSELGTLSKVSNNSHIAYIKMPKYAKMASW